MPIKNIFEELTGNGKVRYGLSTEEIKKLIDACYEFDSENEVGKLYRNKILPLLQATYQFRIETAENPSMSAIRSHYTEQQLLNIIQKINNPLNEAFQHLRIIERSNQPEQLQVMQHAVNYCAQNINARLQRAQQHHEKLFDIYQTNKDKKQ